MQKLYFIIILNFFRLFFYCNNYIYKKYRIS